MFLFFFTVRLHFQALAAELCGILDVHIILNEIGADVVQEEEMVAVATVQDGEEIVSI